MGGFAVNRRILDSIVGLISLLAVTAFLIIGFVYNGWQLGWLVFLAIPVTAILVDIARKRNIAGMLPGLVALLATIAYMIMGFVYDLWHPGWIVFLAIPISGVISGMFGGKDKQPDDIKPDEPKPDDAGRSGGA
jgi:hypothetical protein